MTDDTKDAEDKPDHRFGLPPGTKTGEDVAYPCAVCGRTTDDPETDRWTWHESRRGWVCDRCS